MKSSYVRHKTNESFGVGIVLSETALTANVLWSSRTEPKMISKDFAPWGKPGYILFVQTFGDLVTFHPHIHALVADGVFVESGTFRVLPPIPTVLLAEPLRHAVLDYLVEDEAITEEFAHRLLSWKHS
ncbi:MAG TPA: transposase, partial [Arenicellales bacterium]|nr:transposase [Arenicellales bacterium]